MMKNKRTDIIVERILSKEVSSINDLLNGKIEPTDLQSLLLKLYENLALRVKFKSLFKQSDRNRFVQPCDISQRELLLFDQLIYDVVPDTFSAIELSPVNPLGTNSILSKISQKNVLSTIRNVEVNADVTTALTLECAKLRKKFIRENQTSTKEISLCSSHRSIRLQQFAKTLGFTSHFRVFGACTAGRDIGHERFESENLLSHVGIYLDLLHHANRAGYCTQDIAVYFSDIRITEILINQLQINKNEMMLNTQTKEFNPFASYGVAIPEPVASTEEISLFFISEFKLEKSVGFLREIEKKAISKLSLKYPHITFRFDFKRIAGIGYYENLCFKLMATNKEGITFPLADGGLTDWTKKLLASKKERLFSSGFGSELFCKNFKR